MERYFFRARALALWIVALASCAGVFDDNLCQAQTDTDVAESMGVGMKSRFASGAEPIAIERTKIIPGTPMSVNSTMKNILTSNSGGSFGGILARYDTSNFGKFFGTGTFTTRPNVSSARVDALTNLDQGDNEVENVETERMYPPRLALDFNKYPTRLSSRASSETREVDRLDISSQIENVLTRCDFDPSYERIQAERLGTKIVLNGRVKSFRTSELLERVLTINFGENSIVNNIEIEEANDKECAPLDLYGRPLRRPL
ncbi:MAG: hypothetical protein ACI4SW_02925 [Thermoguttaceae bacterium]